MLHAAAITQEKRQFPICHEIGVGTPGTSTIETLLPWSCTYFFIAHRSKKKCLGECETTSESIRLQVFAAGLKALKTEVKESGFVIFPACIRLSGIFNLLSTPKGEYLYIELSDAETEKLLDSSKMIGLCEEETTKDGERHRHRCKLFD